VEYKNQHGNVDVPANHTQDKTFGKWVARQRANLKTPLDMDEERVQKLTGLGVFHRGASKYSEARWKMGFQLLKNYAAENNHCYTPHDKTASKEYKCLYEWFKRQRSDHGKKLLGQKRAQRLREIPGAWHMITVVRYSKQPNPTVEEVAELKKQITQQGRLLKKKHGQNQEQKIDGSRTARFDATGRWEKETIQRTSDRSKPNGPKCKFKICKNDCRSLPYHSHVHWPAFQYDAKLIALVNGMLGAREAPHHTKHISAWVAEEKPKHLKN